MSLRTKLWFGLFPILLGVVTVGAVLVSQSDRESHAVVIAVVFPVIALSFIVSGLVGWTLSPENGTGKLLALVGALWMISALWDAKVGWVFALGTLFGSLFLAAFVQLMLAFPAGRLASRFERRLIAGLWVVAFLANTLPTLFRRHLSDCKGCPENPVVISNQPGLSDAFEAVFSVLGGVIFLGVIVLLVRRWRRATKAQRRILGPVYLSGGLAAGLVAALFAVGFASNEAGNVLAVAAFTSFGTVPLFFLAGLLRTRLYRAAARLLREVPDEPTPEQAQTGLRNVLGDPTLQFLTWLDEVGGYVDARGNPVGLQADTPLRVTTKIEYEGRQLAAIVHDAALLHQQALLDEVVAAARLAMEKDRGLQALRRSEARSRALLDAIPDLMFRIARDGTYLEAQGDRASLVRSREEIIGSSVQELLPPEVAERFLAALAQPASKGAQTVEYQLEIDGVERDFEARMVPSGDDEVVVIVRDFTERTQLEAEIGRRLQDVQQEQDFTRTVVNTAPIVLMLCDFEGRIIRFNETCERIFGVRDDETTRQRFLWDAFAHPDDAGAVREAFGRVHPLRPVEVESRWRTADGGQRVIAMTIAHIIDGQGVDRRIVAGLDITERKQQADELRASRSRIVEAGDSERRRLERNLHDGAQQRLVSLSLALRLAQSRLRADPDGAEQLLSGAAEELSHALGDLRELARGIHPAVLTDRGLTAALEALAARAPLPVELSTELEERLPGPIEAAAYYVVAEALTNVAKYAEASAVQVRAERLNGRVVVEVADDGVGGADPTRGSGLRGLADRVEALDGSLEVMSAAGAGTRVTAVIPLSAP